MQEINQNRNITWVQNGARNEAYPSNISGFAILKEGTSG